MYLFARTRDRISRFCVAETEYSIVSNIKGRIIEFILFRKSPLSPLYLRRGEGKGSLPASGGAEGDQGLGGIS